MDSIGYIVSDCGRRLRRVFDQRVRALGMTGPQARLLLMVNREPGRAQSYYAGELDVEPITLTRMLDRMEEAELIERCPDPGDRRARLIHCTGHGQSLIVRIEQAAAEFNAAMLSTFAENERAALHTLIERLSDRINEMLAEPEESDG
jgi:MarR family transcriptional regulator, transcriptional regulator for hemolysin